MSHSAPNVTVLDAKDGIVSFTAEGRAEADAKAIASGFTLIDTP